MTKKIELIWRGSITNLATDIAYLLTPEQGESLARELYRILMNHKEKFHGDSK